MTKKTGYKYQIEQELLKNNWEIIEICSSDEWWDDEYWKVKATYSDLIIYIHFIIDPILVSESKREKGLRIYKIITSEQVLNSSNDETFLIANLSMNKRKFNLKLITFITEINQFRINRKQQ